MKVLLFIILSVLNNFTLLAYNQEAFQLNEQRAPYLLQLTIKHLAEHFSKPSLDQEQLIIELKNLNQYSQNIDQEMLVYLTHFQINQAILNQNLNQGYQSNTVTTNDIKEINSKIKKFKELYSDLSLYILTESIADFSTFIDKGVLDKIQSQTPQNQNMLTLKNELKSVIKYSGKWLNNAISLTPEQFNRVVSQVILPALKSLNESLLSVKNYINPDRNFDKVEILPQIQIWDKKSQPESPSTEKDVLKIIEPDVPANPQKEIDQIFEKKLNSSQE